MFCRSSSHILIWGNCNICFHFLLFPFLFPPPPAGRTDLQLRQGGECSKQPTTPASTTGSNCNMTPSVQEESWGCFSMDSNGAPSGPWSSSDTVQYSSVASSELQPKLHRRPPLAGRVRQRRRAKRPSEVRFRSGRASNRTTGAPPLMAQHRTVVNTAARPPDDRKQADRSYQDAFASQIAKAAPALICPSYNGFLSWIQCKQDVLFVDRTWMTGSAPILTINWLIMETLGPLVSAHSISGNGNQDKYGLSLLPPP